MCTRWSLVGPDERIRERGRGNPNDAESADELKNRVLIIEDEAILAKNIQRYLQRHGFNVRVAASGEAGLKEFKESRPDLVLLDYGLPDIDGLKVLDQLRAEHGDVRVIFITAHGNAELAVDAMNAGAADYLSKPVVLSKLKLAVERTIGKE